VDHGAITEDRQVERVAVEGDELRGQLGDVIAESGDELLLEPLAYVRGTTQRVHRPMIALARRPACRYGLEGKEAPVSFLWVDINRASHRPKTTLRRADRGEAEIIVIGTGSLYLHSIPNFPEATVLAVLDQLLLV
jgi:hypothetical protein